MEEANLQKRDSVAASSRLDGASGRNLRIGSSGKSNRKEHALREPAVHLLRLVTGSIGSPHRHQSVQWSFFFFPSSVESLTNQIIWGDKMTGNPHTWKEYYFSIYSFSLCNTALFGSHALAYPASISTSSRCLTVPMQIFDHITGWIPLECPESDASGHTQLCWLGKVHVPLSSHKSWDPTQPFPSFSFALSPQGPSLSLSLEDLLLGEGGRR